MAVVLCDARDDDKDVGVRDRVSRTLLRYIARFELQYVTASPRDSSSNADFTPSVVRQLQETEKRGYTALCTFNIRRSREKKVKSSHEARSRSLPLATQSALPPKRPSSTPACLSAWQSHKPGSFQSSAVTAFRSSSSCSLISAIGSLLALSFMMHASQPGTQKHQGNKRERKPVEVVTRQIYASSFSSSSLNA